MPSSFHPKGGGITFGGGYATATLVSYLLSTVANGVLIRDVPGLASCCVLALLAGACLWWVASLEHASEPVPMLDAASVRSLVTLAGAAVVMASLVKNDGFMSLASEFSGGGGIELSRLFYGMGLVVAGLAADRDRHWALACCVASLALPFVQLALSGAGASGFVLWSLHYLLQSFFTVWRVVLFADLADDAGRVWLAGAGLAIGRVGDAVGAWLTQALEGSPVVLIACTSVFFAVASYLLLRLWVRMPGATMDAGVTVEDAFDPVLDFCDRHNLSRREQDVLRLLLDGMPNAQIARELVVSEATIKFHVSNILKKTGCSRRNDVAKLYNRSLRDS